LGNGETIKLGCEEERKLIAAKQSNIIDTNSTLIYTKAAQLAEQKGTFNTLQTPQGGEYSLVLTDGTKIWLNAASEIKYPVQFNDTIRQVFLKGEAYFEVVENKSKPFIVNTNNIYVTVLGTSFDVMAYQDEENIKTTLVRGRVKIETTTKDTKQTEKVYLQPGQQAVLENTSNKLVVKTVETEIYTSWKEGKFVFNNETLGEIMRKLQRWYVFDIKYRDEETKKIHFSGTVKRYDNISNIIDMIEMTTNIKFEVKENVIMVKKDDK
jgi:ferric-dicitrate binding protein FerR (iron transport regulator)